ncbi:MAG: MFS transporter, partial [Chloroflexi bacterium]|nr:MFS transporter [Chloroflexota bacterium]
IGPRIIMAVGGLVSGAGLVGMSQVHQIWQLYFVFGGIGLVGAVGMGGLVTSTTVAKWFVRRRGRAMAIQSAGMAVGGAIFPLIIDHLITSMGWRGAWFVLGIITWVLIIPLSLLFLRRAPEDMGLRPDGDEEPPSPVGGVVPSSAVAIQVAHEEQAWTLGAAMRTPALWLILLAFSFSSLGTSANAAHRIPYWMDKGFSREVASAALSFDAFFAAITILLFGFLAERFHARHLTMVAFLGLALSMVFYLTAGNTPMMFIANITFGLAIGGQIVLNPLLWANYYGRTFLGTIRGTVAPISLMVGAAAPPFAGFVYDVRGSYFLAYVVFLFTFIGAAALILFAKPPAPPKRRQAEALAKAAEPGAG